MSDPIPSERTKLLGGQDGKSVTFLNDQTLPSIDNKNGNRSVWAVAIGMIIAVAVIFVCIGKYSYHKVENPVVKPGLRVQLQALNGPFVRSSDTLVATEDIPWIAGSTFTIDIGENNCWMLKLSKTEMWVGYSGASSHYFASKFEKSGALCFDVFKLSDEESHMSLRVVEDGQWLTLVELPDSTMALTVTDDKSAKTVFVIHTVDPIVGVNFGGWFIPEVWMTPDFFADTGLGWGGSLCRMREYNEKLTEKRMKHNLERWITEEDIAEVARLGFNSIRLPIGYWNIIEDPYHKFAPADLSVSLHYIDWCFTTAEKFGLSVLLDMHGGPGSQNGIDHSGCSMDPAWTSPENIDLSLQAVEAMAKRYGDRPNLIGFELLNEPSLAIEANHHDDLLQFYKQSYKIIRKRSDTALVVFNELYADYYGAWSDDLQEPEYHNVVVDWHLYDWQEPYTSETIPEHIRDAKNWTAVIARYTRQGGHPVMVGEWTMSTGTVVQAGQPFVDACLESFSHTLGSYAWNWKVQRDIGFDEWDVQVQAETNGGLNIIPPK